MVLLRISNLGHCISQADNSKWGWPSISFCIKALSTGPGSLLQAFGKLANKICSPLFMKLGPGSQGSQPCLWPFIPIDYGSPITDLWSCSYLHIAALINELSWKSLVTTCLVPQARHLSDQVLFFLKAGAEQAARWPLRPVAPAVKEQQSHSQLYYTIRSFQNKPT